MVSAGSIFIVITAPKRDYLLRTHALTVSYPYMLVLLPMNNLTVFQNLTFQSMRATMHFANKCSQQSQLEASILVLHRQNAKYWVNFFLVSTRMDGGDQHLLASLLSFMTCNRHGVLLRCRAEDGIGIYFSSGIFKK